MKLKEYIENIQALYSKGVMSFDSRLSNRHIYSVMNSIRAMLLSQKAKKKQSVSSWSYTTFEFCMKHTGEYIRSESRLPEALTDYNGDLIKFVRYTEGYQNIDKIDPQNVLYQKGNRYTKDKIKYFVEDGYLYLNKRTGPLELKVNMLLSDPANFYLSSHNCEECKNVLDMEYPIDTDLVKPLIDLSAETLVASFQVAGREDIYNNGREDIQTAVETQPRERNGEY